MASRPGDIPAIEAGSGVSEGLLGGMSIPTGMSRRAVNYDDNLDRPMSPPTDINITNLWRRPVIPERKFSRLAEEDESESSIKNTAALEPSQPPAPVVKAKASSVLMNSLIIKQTQESMQSFEKTAGLTDTGYTPHKGLTAEESHYYRMTQSMQKLHMHNSDFKEEKQSSSAQSTPSGTPQSSPKQKRRSWFSSQGSVASLTGSELSSSSSSSMDFGSSEGPVERWSIFGPRPQVHKSITDPGTDHGTAGGFALQSYKGAQKPTPMEVMKAQAVRLAEDPSTFKAPPKMEIPSVDGKKQVTRPHKLKPRDMNVLTPSGF
ncbi:putative monooxygenase p33MONOX isoform X1 [Tachysurus vachellii]|uniref:putative monooxygenase p33MONOX isoform X1 n=1 Tax=Tachysurus vachellii TaxID=175792 RepID=UPI00296B041C|nr:putative monooxygenase p33MONOX isoform X1 [Tachysurus vachellii]XP_060747203.1 putative monooxygenase p33MONOX isoform X1 [Tachysurus vachellii]XP_060747204.1 putative monooxygenase p33MONOX isoform X1 [Tachysurus vachellii]